MSLAELSQTSLEQTLHSHKVPCCRLLQRESACAICLKLPLLPLCSSRASAQATHTVNLTGSEFYLQSNQTPVGEESSMNCVSTENDYQVFGGFAGEKAAAAS